MLTGSPWWNRIGESCIYYTSGEIELVVERLPIPIRYKSLIGITNEAKLYYTERFEIMKCYAVSAYCIVKGSCATG